MIKHEFVLAVASDLLYQQQCEDVTEALELSRRMWDITFGEHSNEAILEEAGDNDSL